MLRAVCVAALVGVASGQLIGIDFGSEFIKVAGVRPKIGVDVVLNEQSKRKSNNYIGFRGAERFVGEDAFNLAPRFPDQMYTFLNRMAGKGFDDAEFKKDFTDGWNLPYALVEHENRTTINIKHSDPATEFTIEELLAQLFDYIRTQAAKHMEMEVTGAVVTLPSTYGFAEKQAFVNAATLVKLPILGFMTGSMAAALQYGIKNRGFGNDTAHVIIYDMGASKTEVGLFRYSKPLEVNGKIVRGGEQGNLEQLAVVCDETLGGRTIDARLANLFAKRFEEETGLSLKDRSSRAVMKAFTVLMRSAQKAKEVLSANKVAPVAVEELFDSRPFFYNLTRVELEESCSDLFARAAPPVTTALEKAGIKPEDLHAVEIIGGGVRIPALQTAISDVLNGRSLDRTLNGDEAIATGATLQSAKLGGAYKIKGFTVTIPSPFNVTFKMSKLPGSKYEPSMRPLFMEPVPGTSRKSISFHNRTEDFEFSMYAVTKDANGNPLPDKLIATYKTEDVAKQLDALGYNKEGKNESNSQSVEFRIKLGNDGLLELQNSQVLYEEHVEVKVKQKIKKDEKKDDEKKDDKDEKKEEKKEEEKKEKEEEKKEEEKKEDDKKEDEKKDEKKDEDEYEVVTKVKVKQHKKPIKVVTVYEKPLPMNEEDFKTSGAVLKELDSFEERKKEAAAAKNDLESYIYWIKYDGMLDNEEMKEFITDEERTALAEQAEAVGDWAEYGEGSEETTMADAFTAKKSELEALCSKPLDRKKEKEEKEKEAAEKAAAEKREAEAKAKAAEEAEKKKEEEAKKGDSEPKDGEKSKEDEKKEKDGDEL